MTNIIVPTECKGCGMCCIWTRHRNTPEKKLCDNCEVSLTFYYGRCEHLTASNECDIYYQNRPAACVNMERGGSGCIESIRLNS